MEPHDKWQERYRTGSTPWDSGRADYNLTRLVMENRLPRGKALEIGCGTGTNAIWLAQHGFEVTAIDIAEDAIKLAKEKAMSFNVDCNFLTGDFMSDNVSGAPFQFVVDRGCFHTLTSDEERTLFAQRVYLHLAPMGFWLSLVGSADAPKRDVGPPQRTARDIVIAVEPCFEIISLVSSHFDSAKPEPPRAWVCLLQKRT